MNFIFWLSLTTVSTFVTSRFLSSVFLLAVGVNTFGIPIILKGESFLTNFFKLNFSPKLYDSNFEATNHSSEVSNFLGGSSLGKKVIDLELYAIFLINFLKSFVFLGNSILFFY